MKYDFFLLDGSIHYTDVPRTKYDSSYGNFLDALFFGGDELKTEEYYAIRNLSSGLTVKYYLTKYYELYESNWWSISIYFIDDQAKLFKKIYDVYWNHYFTKDSLRYAFQKYPNIYEALIKKDKITYSSWNDLSNSHLSAFFHGDYLSVNKEIEEVEELCNVAVGMLKEISCFRINQNDLVRNPTTPRNQIQLPTWLKDGINGAVRIGAKSLAAYIGTNIDTNFDIGNIDIDADFGGDFDGDIDADFGGDFGGDFDGDFDGDFNGDFNDSGISFHASATPSFDTGKDVHIVSESGNDKGYFDVYLHDGKKYIKFGSGSRSQWSNWIKLPSGTNRFSWNGNWYIIK